MPRLLLTIALLLLATPVARADVVEPDGRVIPAGAGELSALFTQQRDRIDLVADAFTGPGTFQPAVGGKLTFLFKGGSQAFELYWYNARFGAARPAASDLHRLMARYTDEGTVVPASAIRDDPAWAGGPVAFMHRSFLPSGRGTADSYTIVAHNQRCTLCATPAPWVTALQYPSRRFPGASYLGFEDYERTEAAFFGDLSFADAVFRVEGLQAAACADATDNDGDGVADRDDRGCADAASTTEADPPLPAVRLDAQSLEARVTAVGTGFGSCVLELDGTALATTVEGTTCRAAVPDGLAPGDHPVRARYRERFATTAEAVADGVHRVAAPEPTPQPTVEPTPEPTAQPTVEPTPEPAPAPLVLQCAGRVIDLVDVGVRGKRVRLFGFTLAAHAGRSVTFNTGATATVRADGSFETFVPRPKDPGTRYTAAIDGQRSPALKLTRRFLLEDQSGTRVRLRLAGRTASGTRIEVTRLESCGRQTVVVRRAVPKRGRLELQLAPGTYRARTVGGRGRTFTLPIVVR